MTIDKCTIEGCTDPVKAKGLCSMHHQRLRRTGSVEAKKPKETQRIANRSSNKSFLLKKCNAYGCNEYASSMGLCKKHLEEWDCGIKIR
jgi:hypothetical protein